MGQRSGGAKEPQRRSGARDDGHPARRRASEPKDEGSAKPSAPAAPEEHMITLIGGPSSCAAARQFVRAVLSESPWQGDQEAAVLLTSEIVANAAQHAGGACNLTVRTQGAMLRIEASDRSKIPPHFSVPEPLDETGRGLLLVDVLSHDWGTKERLDGGKAVWFELRS